jgi:hypothetical protein
MSPSSTEDRSLVPATPLPAPPASRALGFTSFDRAAIAAYVKGDPEAVAALLNDARELASALSGSDGAGSRRRLLSRAAAAERTVQRLISELLAQRLAARDYPAVTALTKVLDGGTRRLVLVLKQLAVEESLRSRASVIVRDSNVAIGVSA